MLTVEGVTKSYGDKVLFNDLHCVIREKDRIGLIGVNGTGKSSFLKIIAGIDQADSGEMVHAKDYRIEYLAQESELDLNTTVIEQIYYGNSDMMRVMRSYEQALAKLEKDSTNERVQNEFLEMQQKMDEAEAWDANAQAKTILNKLGITVYDEQVANLSGGQKKRVALAKALIQQADLLILDEPTNHLDHETIEWLEKYLQNYSGALLLVTHDRYFLNRVTNRIFELDHGNLYVYDGNYELFLEKKREREEIEEGDKRKHANRLRSELAWLRRGAKARSTKQRARIERIEEMQDRKFTQKVGDIEFQAGSQRLGQKVIEFKQLSKAFGERQLIQSFDYLVNPGDRIGIIGPNGSGKTTLLNVLAGRIQADSGEIEIGETVKIGYYTQGDEELDNHKRIIDYIKETAQVIYTKDGEVITAEQMLERFLFSRADQYTYIHRLSGGERRRLYLLKVLMTEPNVLFLDEPTNDLDIQTLSVLEDYLDSFPGVVLTVSHDRYFLDRVVDRLFVFAGEGKIDLYFGNYSEYLEDQETKEKLKVTEEKKQEKQAPQKEKLKTKLSYNEQKEWDTIEEDITKLEERIEQLQAEIAEAGSDSVKVQELFKEQEQIEATLEEKMERWETLSLIVEEIEQNKKK